MPLPPLPGLDGLRGAAVVAVLAYHSGVGWARGGWLGVSAFFTLSGYLITTLLLAEVEARDRISLSAFAGRRARRLLPALLVVVAGVVVVSRWFALPSSLVHLRGDAWAVLGQVANWRFLARGQGYGAQFEATSPLLHTWSLSIEAQAYVLLPLVVVGAVWVARSRGRKAADVVAAAVVGVCVLSLGAGAVLAEGGASVDRLYFGTDVRLAEMLAGSLLAVLLQRRSVERASAEVRRALDTAGLLAVVLGLGAWSVVEQSDRAFYPIGLWAHAAGAAVVIAAVRVRGATARLLALRPLQGVGRISYGVYLYHWPIFTWLTPERSGWPSPVVHGIRLVLTFALAAVSQRLLEDPIRRRRGLMRASRPWLAPVALASIAALALTVTAPPARARLDVASAAEELRRYVASTTTAPGVGATAPSPRTDRPWRVSVLGDSTATMIGAGMIHWAQGSDRMDVVEGLTVPGCSLLRPGEHKTAVAYADTTYDPDCRRWEGLVETSQDVDAVVVSFGAWDLAEHRLPGGEWSHIGRPDVDEALREAIDELADAIVGTGAVVVWLLPPRIWVGSFDGVAPEREDPMSDPERVDRFRTMIREAAAERPGRMVTPDLRSWLGELPGGEMDPAARPDGLHMVPDAAERMTEEWLEPQIGAALAGAP